ncbi:uncharacterized protein EV420DRAFT_1547359 [Desarmillaria tabescens]|uniref:F-box domain-containing protein n=1 Tax=Armillaria tabescens TaxID=1929756 RepID=A0AA39KDC3_ARMTA|nr:uncharacterized protein EV420DRAFT_1547359 [Desarmillaria tabescens]KAK0457781.1 hypothetical protein EV420DRAFT_1547359 [Desarmillaria tabescens]
MTVQLGLSLPQSTMTTVDMVMPSTLHSINDDVLGVICAILDKDELKQLSAVDKRLREVSLPLLLRRVCMRIMHKEGMWQLATDAIESMLTSTAFDVVAGHTRFIDIRLSDDKDEDPLPSVLSGRLAEFLSAPFRQLHTLVFTIDEKQAQTFEDKFIMPHIEIPTVTTLMVGAYCDFMVRLCPNVEHLATYGWIWLHSRRGLIAVASEAKMLKHFEMNEWWSANLLQAVYDAMPSIQNLTLDGGPLRGTLQDLVPILSQFKTLKKLGLVDASCLHVGFNPPRCGNAYMGPNGAEVRRKRLHQS